MKIDIRAAIPNDSESLQACMEAAYAIYQERVGVAPLPPLDVDYLAEIENFPVWVIESEGIILGGLIMVFKKDRASIANIAVNPKFQGQGIGGKLMRFAESEARKANFSELELATHRLFDENVSLYRHLGWEEIGRDETRIFMKKRIAESRGSD